MHFFAITHCSALRFTNVKGKQEIKGHLYDVVSCGWSMTNLLTIVHSPLTRNIISALLKKCIVLHIRQNSQALRWRYFPKPGLERKMDFQYFDNYITSSARNQMWLYQYCKTLPLWNHLCEKKNSYLYPVIGFCQRPGLFPHCR